MDPHAEFWDIAGPLIAEGRAERGTMMRMECLRVNGRFVAGVGFDGELVVKFDRARASDLIESGTAQPFAPAGRVFKEWVCLPTFNRDQWDALVREACVFAAT